MKIFPLGFRTKIALWSALASGLAVLGFSITSAFIVFDNMREEADAEVLDAAERIAAIFERNGETTLVPSMFGVGVELSELRVVEVLGADGETVVDDIDSWPGTEEMSYSKQPKFRTVRADGENWRVVALRHNTSSARVKMAIDLREITREVMRMMKTYLLALPAAMAIAALGGWWVAGRAAKPIRAMTRAAEAIRAERFERRVPVVNVKDEISRLASVLNEMIGRLEVSYAQAQRFSSDASHELRTPIAVLQGKIEEAVQGGDESTRETLAGLGEQVARLKAIVESLLLFSRADGGQLQLEGTRVNLSEILTEMAEDLEGIAEPAGVATSITAEPELWVKGDERLLRMAIFNLLQNGVKYNRGRGGEVRCEAFRTGDADAEDDIVRVRVRNTGEPILEKNREAIFDRFFRGDAGTVRPEPAGTGLGLSLARTVARAHGGEVRLLGCSDGWNTFELDLGYAGRRRRGEEET